MNNNAPEENDVESQCHDAHSHQSTEEAQVQIDNDVATDVVDIGGATTTVHREPLDMNGLEWTPCMKNCCDTTLSRDASVILCGYKITLFFQFF